MIWSFIISSYLLLCGVARAMSMMHSSLCCHEWMCSLFFVNLADLVMRIIDIFSSDFLTQRILRVVMTQ